MELEQYQLFPPLADEEYQALKADIAERGVQMPIVVDEAGNTLDGFHRLKACKELGIKEYPKMICRNLTHEQKIEQALNLNLLRRHLTPEQRAEIVGRLRGEGWSTRRIADKLKVDHSTIVRDLPRGAVAPPQNVEGKDGKSYPAQRPTNILATSEREAQKAQRALMEFPELDLREGVTTVNEVVRAARVARVGAEHAALGKAPMLTVADGPFKVILADPPWRYEERAVPFRWSIENHYPTMMLDEICALAADIDRLAEPDAVLFLWATAPKLAEAVSVMEAWGFEYRTNLIWEKPGLGMGHWGRINHEHLLIGKRGNVAAPFEGDRPASVIKADKGAHSEKPEIFYDIIERMVRTHSRVELFARKARPGWASWGLEAGNGNST